MNVLRLWYSGLVLMGSLLLTLSTEASATPVNAGVFAQIEVRNNTAATATDYHMLIEDPSGIGRPNISATSRFSNFNFILGRDFLNIDFVNGSIPIGGSATVKIRFESNENVMLFKQSFLTFGQGIPTVTVPIWGVGAGPVSPGDPPVTLFNDFDVPIGVTELRAAVNVPEVPFGSDPGSVLQFGPPAPSFILDPHSSRSFNVPGDLAPGNWIYVQGIATNATFTTQFAIINFGHQRGVPEPSSILLVGLGGIGLLLFARKDRRG
jgi:hypothetical protein